MKNDDKAPPSLQLLSMETVCLFSLFMLMLTVAPTFISGEYKFAQLRGTRTEGCGSGGNY